MGFGVSENKFKIKVDSYNNVSDKNYQFVQYEGIDEIDYSKVPEVQYEQVEFRPVVFTLISEFFENADGSVVIPGIIESIEKGSWTPFLESLKNDTIASNVKASSTIYSSFYGLITFDNLSGFSYSLLQ